MHTLNDYTEDNTMAELDGTQARRRTNRDTHNLTCGTRVFVCVRVFR
jgi:hypothetical protein